MKEIFFYCNFKVKDLKKKYFHRNRPNISIHMKIYGEIQRTFVHVIFSHKIRSGLLMEIILGSKFYGSWMDSLVSIFLPNKSTHTFLLNTIHSIDFGCYFRGSFGWFLDDDSFVFFFFICLMFSSKFTLLSKSCFENCFLFDLCKKEFFVLFYLSIFFFCIL